MPARHDSSGKSAPHARAKGGAPRRKRGDTYVRTIEKEYGLDLGVRSDKLLRTVLKEEGVESLSQLIEKKRKETSKGAKALAAVEGIYKNGEVELLERPEDLREARVIVTFLPSASAEPPSGEARNRMLSRMRAGIPLGGPPYPTREEIYERGRKA